MNTKPELGQLKAAIERVSIACNAVDSFLYRFNGPQETGEGATSPQPPESYRNDLNQLFEQIGRLETLTAALNNIG